MAKKKMSGKMIGIIVAAVALIVAVTVILVIVFQKDEDSYRSIQIYKMEGTASIEREGIGTIDAVENLYLQSGDRISVDGGSYMRLKLDDDKYIMVEEASVFTIVAEGTKDSSRTRIELEKGAITNEIRNKLSEDSSYEVTTPNSVMAVRGTVFRVEITFDDNNEVYTKVATFEGKVGSSLILPDGTAKEENVFVEGGKQVVIHMDTKNTEYVVEPQDIDYSTLDVTTLEFLQDVIENGTELVGISIKDIEELVGESQEESSKDNKDEKYTVTFIFGDEVFGTQIVESGQKATVPKLSPAENGSWDFDFSKEITEDTIIRWK